MGAEESILSQYEVVEAYDIKNNESDKTEEPRNRNSELQESTARGGPKEANCRIFSALHKENDSSVSILVFDRNKQTKCQIGSSYAEVLRVVRHPFILKYIGIAETDKHIKIVTEEVLPLHFCIQELEDFEIISGLHNILEAIIFLHEKGLLAHRSICWSSIFISRQYGTWKLGGMDKVEKCSQNGIDADVREFAEFAVSVISLISNGVEESEFVTKLVKDYCLQDTTTGKDAIDTPVFTTSDLNALLQEPIFRNTYLEIAKFLHAITMKEESEKVLFFRTLADKLRGLDPDTVARKFLPKLLSKMVLVEPAAEAFFLPHLLTFGEGHETEDFQAVFPDDLFRKYCVPLLMRLLWSNETHVRILLLKYISLFANAIEKDVLVDEVLPEILIGVRDENDAIVSATLHGLGCLVSILGGKTVIGGERGKYFIDQRPRFESSRNQPVCNAVRQKSEDSALSGSPVSDIKPDRREMMQKKKEERKRTLELRRKEQESKREERKKQDIKEVRPPSPIINNDERMNDTEMSEIPTSNEEAKLKYSSKHNKSEESEPEWEGFEAFSSESGPDEDTGFDHAKSSRSAENLLLISKDSLRMSNTENSLVQNIANPGIPGGNKPLNKKTKAMILGGKTDKASNVRFERRSSVSSTASRESDHSDLTSLVMTDKGNAKPQTLLLKSSVTANSKAEPKVTSNKLGEEFEFQISVNRSTEPDFFADMTPDLTKSKTVLIETNLPNISSKFKATEAVDEVTSGWDEGGWDEFS